MIVVPPAGHVHYDNDPANGLAHERFERAAKAAPDRPALITGDEILTMADLNGGANAIAYRLLDLGLPPAAPVALFIKHGSERVAAAVGVWKAGAAYVLIDPFHKDQGVRDLLGHTEASVLLVDQANEDRARALAEASVTVISVPSLMAQPVARNPDLAINADHMCRIAYTSGSTGDPKGIIRTHRIELTVAAISSDLGKIGKNDRILHLQNFWLTTLLGALSLGATGYPFDLREHGFGVLRNLLLRERITYYSGILTGFRQFLIALDENDFFPDMRVVSVAGEALYREDVTRFDRAFQRTCAFINTLGSTEQAIMTYFVSDRSALPPDGTIVPIGKAVPFTDVVLLDEDGRPTRLGEIGEIAVRSTALSPGYWKNPALSADVWQDDPAQAGHRIYRTGDLAVMDAEGCLHGKGRADQQVKIRGHRVLLGEIESALSNHPAIKAAVVVLDRIAVGSERLVGYVMGETEAVPTTTALRAYLGRTLPDHMVPALFMPVAHFELTATGKVDRRRLPPPKIDIHDRDGVVVAPQNGTERVLKKIWEELLDEQGISVEDDFFLIGGDSVKALTMFLEAERRLGTTLPFESLWLHGSTIRALARGMNGEAPAAGWSQALPLQTNGSKPLLFVVSMVSMPVYCLSLIRHMGGDQPVYGLPAKGIGGDTLPDRRITDMADHCIRLMRQVEPDGPYSVMGHSAAGLVAFEVACRLRAQGLEVSKLVLLDSDLPGSTGKLAGKALSRPLRAAHFAGSLIGQTLGFADPDNPVTLRSARIHARIGYRPRPYDGPATLITSAERSDPADLIERWQPLIAGGLTAIAAPGDHNSMLQEPHVGDLARILVQTLSD